MARMDKIRLSRLESVLCFLFLVALQQMMM